MTWSTEEAIFGYGEHTGLYYCLIRATLQSGAGRTIHQAYTVARAARIPEVS